MSFPDALRIRLSPEKRLLYEAQASHQGQSLSAYIRDRLDAYDDLEQQLASYQNHLSQIEKKLDHVLSQKQDSVTSSSMSTKASLSDQSLLIESLLLLRTLVSPADRNMMQNELQRLGYPLWTPQKAETS